VLLNFAGDPSSARTIGSAGDYIKTGVPDGATWLRIIYFRFLRGNEFDPNRPGKRFVLPSAAS
jgi:hypothetical protein